MYRDRFKQFGGQYIGDIIEYLKNYIEKNPNVTITVGCDSIQKRRRTLFAITIMMYNSDIRNGAHVVFFRESFKIIKDHNERLYREALYVHDVASFLNTELSKFYTRKDLTELEHRKYKYHLAKCNHQFLNVPSHQDDSVMNSLPLTNTDLSANYKLVDIHVDFNPFEGIKNEKGIAKNKSYNAYRDYAPWLRGLGFRTWAKPLSYASTTAADLLIQD